MSEGGSSEEFASEEADAEDEEAEQEEVENSVEGTVERNNPLNQELAGESLSLLCRTGNGLSHAYVKMDLQDKDLTDITILENFQHIRYVDVSGNALEDISILGTLPHLLTIKADHNRLTSPKLPELQYLQMASFANNQITSTDGIAHPMLKSLNLSSNTISELTGLNSKNLPCLQILDLHANQLQSSTGINLPTLQKLYLASNKLEQCDELQGLHQLTTLHMRDNQIATLDGFAPSLAVLQYLNLRGNVVENMSEVTKLKCLPLLKALVLDDNPLCEREDYRVEVCLAIRQLERLDKEDFSEDERADAEELFQQKQEQEETLNS